jgi:hypothetical protein
VKRKREGMKKKTKEITWASLSGDNQLPAGGTHDFSKIPWRF